MNAKGKMLKKLLNKYGIYAFSFMAFVLLLVVIIPNFSSTSENKDYVVRSSNAITRQPVEANNDSDTFKKNDNKDIEVLLNNYYNSLMGKPELLLTRYVDDVERIPAPTKKLYANYVYMINDMEYYVAEGLTDNSYVVVVVGYQAIKGIKLDVPFIDKLLVRSNSEGNMYVSNKETNESVTAYNELMFEAELIKKLSAKVAVEYDSILDRNPDLQRIFASLGEY